MKLSTRQYNKMLEENQISMIYNGPIWPGGIDGMAEMLLKRLEYEELSMNTSQSVFSVFIEQMNNMLLYSADKEIHMEFENTEAEVSKGMFIMGVQNASYFIQTGNAVTSIRAKILKERIDHLNTLDKKELRKYYKEQLRADNENPESKGAGIGLIEIMRRASAPLEYTFEPLGNGLQYFSMYISIN